MSKQLIESLRQTPPTMLPGWGRVPEYTNWMDEQMSWKETCYVGDWSFLANLEVEGPDALKMFSDISVNSFAKFDIGQAKHVIQCNENGKVISEGILLRLASDRFFIQSVPAFYAAYRTLAGGYDARVRFENRYFYQVQGPNALTLLARLVDRSLDDVGFMRFKHVEIEGRSVLALRQGMSGEIGGFELQGPAVDGQVILDAILEAGRDLGIRRLGTRTAMINHLEAWYPTVVQHYLPAIFGPDLAGYRDYLRSPTPIEQGYPEDRIAYMRRLSFSLTGSYQGDDISEYYRSPVELGWSKNIKFDHDFIGRLALEEEVSNPKRVGVMLEFVSEDIVAMFASLFGAAEPYTLMDLPHHQLAAAHASSILKDNRLVGISFYPSYSVYFRKVLSISCIDIEFSQPGTEVTVLWGEPGRPQLKLRATVASAPYKKDKRRDRLVAAAVN